MTFWILLQTTRKTVQERMILRDVSNKEMNRVIPANGGFILSQGSVILMHPPRKRPVYLLIKEITRLPWRITAGCPSLYRKQFSSRFPGPIGSTDYCLSVPNDLALLIDLLCVRDVCKYIYAVQWRTFRDQPSCPRTRVRILNMRLPGSRSHIVQVKSINWSLWCDLSTYVILELMLYMAH